MALSELEFNQKLIILVHNILIMPDTPKNNIAHYDKRITNIILNHWREIKGNKKYPSEKDLNPAILESILDNCFLVQAEGILEGQYKYKFLGKNIMNAYGSDLIEGSEKNPLAYAEMAKKVVQTGEPLSDSGNFKNTKGHLVKYRICVVPLSSDAENIDAVFGGMRFLIEES